MNKPKDKIEELFQSQINDFDKLPDDSLWTDIEANLPPVVSPVYKLWRWGLAAALLVFSLVGYVAYQSFGVRQKTGVVGLKENTPTIGTNAKKTIGEKDTKTASGGNESNLTEIESSKQTIIAREAKKDRIVVVEGATSKNKVTDISKVDKGQKNKPSTAPKAVAKSTELLTQNERHGPFNRNKIVGEPETERQIIASVSNDNQIKDSQVINSLEEENNGQQNTIAKVDYIQRLSAIDYLSNKSNIVANEILLNTHIAYEADYHPKEQNESFFKVPSEVYVSLTPSLNYYRVFSNTVINQFNGADNGGRVGWAVQAGAVYPLKFRRFNYRVGLSYFSAQSNFRYNVVNRTQLPIRVNNNTFEYVNVENLHTESKKWQVLEIQNDLMYKVRPMQDFILGFKAGSSFTEKPVFDAYTGYRFSRQVSNRQVLWIEAAYAYAINSQKSSNNTFSYHMDKYSLRIGVNFR